MLRGLVCVLAVAGACAEAPPVIESTTVLSDTADTVGPYAVQTVVTGVTDHVVELRYRVDDEVRFIPLVMTTGDSSDRYAAAIPGLPLGSTVFYYVAVLADGDRVSADPEGAGARPYVFTIRAE